MRQEFSIDRTVLKQDDEHGLLLTIEDIERRGLVMTDEPYDLGYAFRRGDELYRGLPMGKQYFLLKQDKE